MAGSRRVPDSAGTPVESKLLQRGGELATLTGRKIRYSSNADDPALLRGGLGLGRSLPASQNGRQPAPQESRFRHRWPSQESHAHTRQRVTWDCLRIEQPVLNSPPRQCRCPTNNTRRAVSSACSERQLTMCIGSAVGLGTTGSACACAAIRRSGPKYVRIRATPLCICAAHADTNRISRFAAGAPGNVFPTPFALNGQG